MAIKRSQVFIGDELDGDSGAVLAAICP